MQISELKQWIEFWHVPAIAVKGNGDRIGTEVKLYGCWAKVSPLTGTARMYAEQETNTQPYNITTRWYPVLEGTAGAVIVWKGKRLKVNGNPSNDKGENQWLLFRASEEN